MDSRNTLSIEEEKEEAVSVVVGSNLPLNVSLAYVTEVTGFASSFWGLLAMRKQLVLLAVCH